MIRRRAALVAGCAAAFSAHGQDNGKRAAVARVAFLEAGSASTNRHFLEAFETGLRELGYRVGRQVVIDALWAEGQADRFAPLAQELLQRKPDVMVVASTLGAVAIKPVVKVTPVVFVGVADPQAAGLVETLARPGGNFTGLSRVFGEGLLGKAVQILTGIEPAFRRMKSERADVLVVITDPLTLRHRQAVVDLAARERIPAVYEFAEFARSGGLVAYSASVPALFKRSAMYVDKILRGANPGELPVEQPTVFELVINLKTARTLGLTVPPSIVSRADEVIE